MQSEGRLEWPADDAVLFSLTLAVHPRDGHVQAAKFVRLASVTYPGPASPRVVYYNYPAAGDDGDRLSRLDNVASTGTDPGAADQFAAYTYLGAGTIVRVAHPAVGTGTPPSGLTLDYGSGGTYGGLDRFGRVVDQKWTNAAGTATMDRFRYGHDAGGNRIWKENKVAADLTPTRKNLDEFYAYDGLDRLASADRGALTGGPPPTGVTSMNFAQQWAGSGAGDAKLDQLGNWLRFKQDTTGGGWDLDQNRLHNTANKIDNDEDHANDPEDEDPAVHSIDATTGSAWVSPV